MLVVALALRKDRDAGTLHNVRRMRPSRWVERENQQPLALPAVRRAGRLPLVLPLPSATANEVRAPKGGAYLMLRSSHKAAPFLLPRRRGCGLPRNGPTIGRPATADRETGYGGSRGEGKAPERSRQEPLR